MSNHISSVINNQKDPIANSQLDKSFKTNSQLVDKLLADYSSLIDPRFTKWFAKKFYTAPFDAIHRAASEAKADGRDSMRLFAHLINKL